MEVRVIKAPEPRKPKQVSIPLIAAAGGVTGYALKYALPLGLDEINEATNGQYKKQLRKSVVDARNSEIQEIKNILAKEPANKAADLFIKCKSEIPDVRNAARLEIKNAAPKLKNEIKEFAHAVSVKGKVAYNSTKLLLDASIKHNRVTSFFVVPGIVLGVVGGFVYNVIGKFKDS